jgi:phage-related protein
MPTKPVVFLGDALGRVKGFPEDARRTIGHELRDVQNGGEPSDWKPMPSVGPGVREIRVREASGAFRVVYLANLKTAVYVLHAFRKKTQATPKADLDLARARLRTLLAE